jgi:hypothetical protein
MGRKNRNKITKEKDDTNVLQEVEELSILQQQENIKQQKIFKDDLIWDMRHEMLQYCDKTATPLCDYLTPEIFNQFIEYLAE